MPRAPRPPVVETLRVAIAYALFGALWIVVFDMVVPRITSDPTRITSLHTVRDWLFIAASAAVLAGLVYGALARARHTQRALEETQAGHRQLFQANPLPMWIFDPETLRFLDVNGAAVAHYGYTRDQFLQMTVADIQPPGDLPALREAVASTADGQAYAGFWRHLRKDGSTIEVETSSHGLEWQGRPARCVVAADVTERRRAERAVRASEERLRIGLRGIGAAMNVVEAAPEVNDVSDTRLFVDPAMKRMLGYADHEFPDDLGEWIARIHPDDRPSFDARFDVLRERKPGLSHARYRMRHRDGSWRWIEAHGAWMEASKGPPTRFVSLLRDVTDEIAHRDEARQLSRLLQVVFEESGVPMALISSEGHIELANSGFERFLQATPGGLVGRHFADLTHPDDREEADLVRAGLRGPGDSVTREQRLRRDDGTGVWGQVSLAAVPHDAGYRIFAQVQDITPRKEAEARLREREALLRIALAAGRHGLYDVNLRTGAAVLNEDYTRMLGFEPHEMLGTVDEWREALHPDDRERTMRLYDDFVAGRTEEYRLEFRQRTKSGEWRWVESRAAIVEWDRDGKPLRMVGTRNDVTARKEREAALQRANRALRLRAEVNRLIAGAHDERTLMQGICRLAVELGGYRLAWIGRALDDADRRVEPVAAAGPALTYLETLHVTWADEPHGRGPTGTAIRTGETQLVQDVASDPSFGPWREAATAHGFRAAIAVPLRLGGRTVGALSLHTDASETFHPEEIALLSDVGRDLAFGLTALHARERVEALLGMQEETVEAERARVSQELHDELGQALTGIKIDLGWLRDHLSRELMEGALGDRLRDAIGLVDGTVDTVRRISGDLRPGVLDDLGLEPALSWLVRDVGKRTGLAIQLDKQSALPDLPPPAATAVFRVVQEAFTNVARHAPGAHVVLRYGEGDGLLRVAVSDDGPGFDAKAPRGPREALGLLGMQERVRRHGGEVTITSTKGLGTTVSLTLPVGPAGT